MVPTKHPGPFLETPPPSSVQSAPSIAALLEGRTDPVFPELNIYPLEWRTETPRLWELFHRARDPGWSPPKLAWDTLDPEAFTWDQRYALSHWWGLLSTFDGSGPVVFARAMIHAFETHEEDPIRKCFFSITRDELNHEEVCQRAIQTLTPGGPLGYKPRTPLGELAQNNIRWLYYNGARYWDGYKNAVHKYPLPILFTSFLMGEVASSTLFNSMYRNTTIPVFKEAFKHIGQDEARHMGICLAVLEKVLPALNAEQKTQITRQIRAGFVFLSAVLYEAPDQFWELPSNFRETARMIDDVARGAGLGVLPVEDKKENWRNAILKMKGLVEPYGIVFPALPEIGIDGETTAFDPADIIPVF
jgi:rubrerythrin